MALFFGNVAKGMSTSREPAISSEGGPCQEEAT